ncbi:MAG: LTA synthase family protein [Bacteroidetes bacterium]|nr:LTA synthase family protein [Bacteroidota bacterium]
MRSWRYYTLLAFTAILLLFALRLLFFYYNNQELVSHPPSGSLWLGLRFDLLVISYWLAPAVLLNVISHIRTLPGFLRRIEKYYLHAGLQLLLLAGTADIVYYHYFFSHLSAGILQYLSSPAEALSMLWHENLYRYAFFLMLLAGIGLYLWNRLLLQSYLAEKQTHRTSRQIAIGFTCLALVFLGMRGRLQGKPIGMRELRSQSHDFFNQVAGNPLFLLVEKSIGGSNLRFPTLDESLAWIEMNVGHTLVPDQPHHHLQQQGVTPDRPNIVFILMESMGRVSMGKHDTATSLTPFLDSLTLQGIYFDSFYAAGEHTYNGVFSALYGMPSLAGKHMLRFAENRQLGGLPGCLKQYGYRNIFQIPHTRSFDNMNAFLWKHHFDSLTDVAVMPARYKGGSAWGTCDHKMFQYTLDNLDTLTSRKKPVFSVLLTISNHPPYDLPAGSPEFLQKLPPDKAAIAYADWSLRDFFTRASTKKWFSNTVFVLVGDHGKAPVAQDFPLPLSYHHVPCIFYGKGIKPKKIHNLATQYDIPLTLARVLGFRYTFPTLGADAINKPGNTAFFCSEYMYGFIRQGKYSTLEEDGNCNEYALFASPKVQSATPVTLEADKGLLSYIRATSQLLQPDAN